MTIRVIAICLLLGSSTLRAQLTSGQIAGSITDSQGLGVPGARIAIEHRATGQAFEVRSNDTGSYLARSLPIGECSVKVEANGFKAVTRNGIQLTASQVARVDFVLDVGSVSDSVTVSAELSPVNTSTATLESMIDSKRLANLPMSGRNTIGFTALSPAVTRTSLVTNASRSQNSVNVNGNRSYSTNISLDGNTMYYAHRGAALVEPPPDAVEEIKVITSGVNAEYGRGSAVVSMITKSGTNEFHGSLYDYFRNDDMDARSFFSRAVPKLRYNQFGGSVGGPIVHNRAFFFVSYQRLESRADSVASSAFPPTADERAGNFSGVSARPNDPTTGQPFPGGIIPKARMDPVSLRLLDLFPLPNLPNGSYVAQVSAAAKDNNLMARADYDFGPRDRTNVRFYFTEPTQDFPFSGASNIDKYAPSVETGRSDSVDITHTHTFTPSLLLNARLSWTGFRWSAVNLVRKTLPDFGSNFVVGCCQGSMPRLTIPGRVEANSNTDASRLSDTFEGNADVSWFHGKHEIKFGGSSHRISYRTYQSGVAYGEFTFDGTFSKNSVADFLLGAPSLLNQDDGRKNIGHYWYGAGFVQDRWRATRRLTISAGLRWEAFTPWRTPDGNFAVLSPGARSTFIKNAPVGMIYDKDPGFPLQGDPVNPGPRIGFAYDVFGDGKTSIRGGYGISYDPLIAETAIGFSAQPFGHALTTTNVGPLSDPQKFSQILFGRPVDLGNPTFALPVAISTSFLPGVVTPYTQSMNLTVERELPGNLMLQASYVSLLGRKNPIGNQQNPAIYDATATTRNTDQRRIYQNFTSVFAFSTDANSDYHALQLMLNKRFSRGYTFQVGYAFSKAIDEVGTSEVAQWTAQSPYNRVGSRGLGDFDTRQRLIASWLWEIPWLRQQTNLAGKLFGGWQLSGITTLQDGKPFTVTTGRDNSLQGANTQLNTDRPDLFGNPALSTDRPKAQVLNRYFDVTQFVANQPGQFGNAGRNILIGPGLVTYDLSLRKRFAIRERKNLDLLWQAFNALNRANFGQPQSVLSSGASLGRITSASSGRTMQLALRFEF